MSTEIARRWYRQAVHDLQMAERNVLIGGYDVAAFLAHQAVEKLLKAAFAMEDKSIPRTHYIDELARRLHLPGDLTDALLELTPDYMLARYPDVAGTVPYEQYTEELAEEKVRVAKRVLEYFQRRWGQP
ncbi:MAG TPA: HEPN domain-containing protein [Planctomycetaceae bacterium]|nr:HEPN domain-containing protein [Planctomycetaceae bacterium]